jgi:CRP-like cAMP-binding protein
MPTGSPVNARALKDEVAQLLRKGKFDRAAEVLEQLARAEPKEMTHRLKLGDTYRRLDQKQKAISAYQHAARFFGDEGQLIKAIGAAKIVLEIDPANDAAQGQLAEMNQRRLGKAVIEAVPRSASPTSLRTSAAERHDAAAAVQAVGGAMQVEFDPGDDDEPLELDDGRSSRSVIIPPPPSAAPKKAKGEPPRVGPPPKIRPAFEIGSNEPPDLAVPPPIAPPPSPARRGKEPIELPPDEAETEAGEAEASGPIEFDPSELVPLDEEPAPPPQRSPPAPQRPAITVSDEIDFEDEDEEPPMAERGQPAAAPIADLLSGDAEEEVELLSMASDDEAAGARPVEGGALPRASDVDAAFGSIADETKPGARRVPTKKVPLFDDLSQGAFVELVKKLGYHRQKTGQLILREGDPGRSFYVIVEGEVRIYKTGADGQEITLARLGEGAFFGEMALLSGAPRTANVVAEKRTELLEVSDVVLRELAAKYPQVVTSLKNFYRQRLLSNVMAISPLFRDFDPQQRKAIAEKFRMRQAAPGEMLIAEGKTSDGLYVVLHGAVQVAAARGAASVELATLKEGDIFGEMSLLTRKPATATVTAQGRSIVLRLPRESFQELVLTHPQILELVSELTEQRKSATDAILHDENGGMPFV